MGITVPNLLAGTHDVSSTVADSEVCHAQSPFLHLRSNKGLLVTALHLDEPDLQLLGGPLAK